jgi:hypothetical protein
MRGGLAVRDVARSIRFQQHPTLTACWVWTGYTDSRGYGYAFVGGHTLTARQAVYARYRGEPEGNLKPTCGVNLCVNPSHLEVR